MTRSATLRRSAGSCASLHVVEGGDHSLALLKREGGAAAQETVLDEAADAIVAFIRKNVRKSRARGT